MKHKLGYPTKHPLYATWQSMKARCYNRNEPAYKYYGARGIRVCDEWLADFYNFAGDVGYKPSDQHSLDRIDNNGDYTPDNCHWATAKEQTHNSRCMVVKNLFSGVREV